MKHSQVLVGMCLAASVAGCAAQQVNAKQPVPMTLGTAKNASKQVYNEDDDAKKPQFPLVGETGHRTDPDGDDGKVDSYVKVSVNQDGSWSAFMHTTPTTHFVGGCAMYSVVLYDENSNWLFARDLSNFCTGTRDGIGGPSDRQDNVSGGPGEFPTDALLRTRKWSVVARTGEGPQISMDQVAQAVKVIAQVVALVASAS